MYQDKMAMNSAFNKLMLLFCMAHVTSALNSPVPVVHTVSNVTLISGREGTLTCYYNRTVYAVYWRYENTTSPRELLVALDKYYEDGKRGGLGYDKGRFNMTDDYSLIIHDVQATDEGRYMCEVADYETGSLFRSHTDVITVETAERPFIRIGQCEDDDSADEIHEPCVLHTTLDDPNIELTCTVLGAKPMVDLTWESSLSAEHWKQVMNESALSTRDRGNGVFDQTLTLIVDTSYIKSNKQLFTCVGKGLAVDGMANYTIAVHPAQDSNVTRTVVAVVVSVVCALLFTFVIIGVWWKLTDKRPSQKAPLEEMIKKIRDMKADERVDLGVFGDDGDEKSSFIESIRSLIKENDGSTEPQFRIYPDKSSEIWEYSKMISEGLRLRKHRNDVIKQEEILAILMSEEKDNSSSMADIDMETDDLIHYPIFIFDISNKNDGYNRIELLKELAGAIYDHILQYPMIVLTKAITARTDVDEKKLIRKLIKKTRIPRENILVTFQFSSPKDKIDEHTRAEQLDFILKCVDKVRQKKDIKNPLSEEERIEIPLLNDSAV